MNDRVLLVEDAPEISELIATILEEETSYHLIVAADGEAGLELARSQLPDLILLDLSLPLLSGWDLLPRLRAEGIQAPVIAITAHAMAGDRERALGLGCAAYLAKPFEIDDLLDLLRRYAPEG